MFAAAVVEFGKVDLVGHLPIIASLALVAMRGSGDVGHSKMDAKAWGRRWGVHLPVR